MSNVATVEAEMAWLGDSDDRVARAIVLENYGLHKIHEITCRAIEAVEAQGRDAWPSRPLTPRIRVLMRHEHHSDRAFGHGGGSRQAGRRSW